MVDGFRCYRAKSELNIGWRGLNSNKIINAYSDDTLPSMNCAIAGFFHSWASTLLRSLLLTI